MTNERSAYISHVLGLDLSGHVLDGRYQILRHLGSGGMATVYEGRRVGLDRRLAIKILRAELSQDPHNVKRFLREAQAAATLEHPNVVSIIDVGGAATPVYFVMEFLAGQDLRQTLAASGPWDWPRTRELALQVARALGAAHLHGIIHRDVKPANCMVLQDENGHDHIKLLDFGIAKVMEDAQALTHSVTSTGGVIGTVAYMAPEQARGRAVDARTDVYALGTMLYELLTGSVPFPDKNPFVAVNRQLNEAPTPLRALRPDLSEEAEAIVMTCLQKDPEARFQGMDALIGALRACDHGVAATDVVASVRPWPHGRAAQDQTDGGQSRGPSAPGQGTEPDAESEAPATSDPPALGGSLELSTGSSHPLRWAMAACFVLGLGIVGSALWARARDTDEARSNVVIDAHGDATQGQDGTASDEAELKPTVPPGGPGQGDPKPASPGPRVDPELPTDDATSKSPPGTTTEPDDTAAGASPSGALKRPNARDASGRTGPSRGPSREGTTRPRGPATPSAERSGHAPAPPPKGKPDEPTAPAKPDPDLVSPDLRNPFAP